MSNEHHPMAVYAALTGCLFARCGINIAAAQDPLGVLYRVLPPYHSGWGLHYQPLIRVWTQGPVSARSAYPLLHVNDIPASILGCLTPELIDSITDKESLP